jgi:hypothetical protein
VILQRQPDVPLMLAKLLLRYFSRLKFPWLFAVTAILFGLNLVIPDPIPFVDELLLGLVTLLLGTWRLRKSEAHAERSNVIDVEKVRPSGG